MMLRPNPWKPDYVGAYTGPLDPIDALRNGANDRWKQVLFLLSEIERDAAEIIQLLQKVCVFTDRSGK
jgi:hypothetical protein